MPDPDRRPRDRYESDAYRYNSRDSRYPYRWNPDRFEDRFRDRDDRSQWDLRWNRDARDLGRDYDRDYGRGGGYPFDRGYDRPYDRYDFDRGWNERDRSGYYGSGGPNSGGYYEGDFGGPRDYDRDREWRERERWGNDWDDRDRWRNNRGGGRW